MGGRLDAKRDTGAHAAGLAKLAKSAGLAGVVCSTHDLAGIRAATGPEFLTVVPGIRPAENAVHDQKRVATPKSAIAAGADILVIGRAITGAADPAAAAQRFWKTCVMVDVKICGLSTMEFG